MKRVKLSGLVFSLLTSFSLVSTSSAEIYTGSCQHRSAVVVVGNAWPNTTRNLASVQTNFCEFRIDSQSATNSYIAYRMSFFDPRAQKNATTTQRLNGATISANSGSITLNLNGGRIALNLANRLMTGSVLPDNHIGGYGFNFSGPALLAPQVTSLSPNSGPVTGGTTLTINGANFVSGATVRIGGTLATNVRFQNANSITCTTPAHAAGSADVVATNPDRQSSGSASFAYTPVVQNSPTPTPTPNPY